MTVPLALFSLLFANKLATIYASRLLQLHIFYLALPISLNSLDRKGAILLSPCGSQITSKPDAGPDDSVPDDALELKWEFNEDSRRYYVSFPDQLETKQHNEHDPHQART